MKEITYKAPSHFFLPPSMRDQWCDVTIQVDGQRFRTHKIVLAATIPYFQRMFFADFQESNMEIVQMNNITASNMDILIAFAYTGEITIRESNVVNLLEDVDYLLLTDIKQECEKFLVSDLRVENFWKIYHLADVLSCSLLKEETYRFIWRNIHNIVKTEDFLDFEFNLLTDVLIANDFQNAIFSPPELFEIIIKWIMNNFDDRRIHLPELIQCDKFSALFFIDIQNYICKDEVMDKLSERELSDLVSDILYLHLSSNKQGVKNDFVDDRCCNQAGRFILIERREQESIKIYDPCTAEWESISIQESCDISWLTLFERRLYMLTDNVLRFYEFKDERWGEMPMECFNKSHPVFVAGLGGYLYTCIKKTYAHSDNMDPSEFARFCLRTQVWENLRPINVVLICSAIITFRRHIYVIGGTTSLGGPESNIVQRYDPEADKWRIFSRMLENRTDAEAAVLNEKIYVCGGHRSSRYLKSVEFYDPETNKWEYAAPLNQARANFSLVAYAGYLWAFGGFCGNDGKRVLSTEVYNPDKNRWSFIFSGETNLIDCVGVLFD